MTSNDSQPRYLDEVTLDQLNPPHVLTIYSINLALSTCITLTAVLHWSKLRTAFNAAVIWSSMPLFSADVCYFFTIGRNANEVVRAMSPVCCAWLMCALACIRFKVFSSAGLAPWYSLRVSTGLISFIYLHGALVMVCQFGVNVLVDLFIAAITFRIVWGLRKAVIRRRNAAAGPARANSGRRSRHEEAVGAGAQTNANHLATLTVPDMIRTTASGGNAAIPQSMVANIGSRNLGGGGSRSVVGASSIQEVSIGISEIVKGSWVSSWQQKSSSSSTSRAQQPGGSHVGKPGKGRLKRARATFQKRSAFVLVLLGFMLSVSLAGIVIFVLSTDMFGDALGLLSMRLYIMSTIHLFNIIV
ncbi:hypothetical protein BCR44DRAFT_1435010, partial [Catenaria anguillulae PL171]